MGTTMEHSNGPLKCIINLILVMLEGVAGIGKTTFLLNTQIEILHEFDEYGLLVKHKGGLRLVFFKDGFEHGASAQKKSIKRPARMNAFKSVVERAMAEIRDVDKYGNNVTCEVVFEASARPDFMADCLNVFSEVVGNSDDTFGDVVVLYPKGFGKVKLKDGLAYLIGVCENRETDEKVPKILRTTLPPKEVKGAFIRYFGGKAERLHAQMNKAEAELAAPYQSAMDNLAVKIHALKGKKVQDGTYCVNYEKRVKAYLAAAFLAERATFLATRAAFGAMRVEFANA